MVFYVLINQQHLEELHTEEAHLKKRIRSLIEEKAQSATSAAAQEQELELRQTRDARLEVQQQMSNLTSNQLTIERLLEKLGSRQAFLEKRIAELEQSLSTDVDTPAETE